MADAPFYRPITDDLAQGDIFEGVPHVHSRSPIQVVRKVDPKKSNRPIWGLYQWPPAQGQQPALPKDGVLGGGFHLEPTKGEDVASFCEVGRSIALNHECDLVVTQEPKYRLVAMVLPLGTVQNKLVPTPSGEQKFVWDVIRDNQNYYRFHLPPIPGALEESYVDLRRINCVAPDFLDPGKRIGSLSEDAFKALMRQLFLALTHVELKPQAPMAPVEPVRPTLRALLRQWGEDLGLVRKKKP